MVSFLASFLVNRWNVFYNLLSAFYHWFLQTNNSIMISQSLFLKTSIWNRRKIRAKLFQTHLMMELWWYKRILNLIHALRKRNQLKTKSYFRIQKLMWFSNKMLHLKKRFLDTKNQWMNSCQSTKLLKMTIWQMAYLNMNMDYKRKLFSDSRKKLSFLTVSFACC